MTTHILWARSGAQVKLHPRKIGHVQRTFFTADDKLLLKLMSTSMPEKKLPLTDIKIILSFMFVFKIVIMLLCSLLMLELFWLQWEAWLNFEYVGGHPWSMYAKFDEKLTFLTPWYAHVRVRIRGLWMIFFWKI